MKLRVKEILKEKGLTQVWLAGELGVNTVTLSRKLNRKNVDKLDIKWMTRIADALHVEPAALIKRPISARSIPVIAYVQAGEWAESWEWEEEDRYEVPVTQDPLFENFRLIGVETRGPSMNRVYPEGTVLILTDYSETGEDLIIGKRYVVERERADGLREATVKTLWKDENGRMWLIPESSDPRYQQPIALDGDDGETIRIIGRVRYALRRE